MFLFFISFSTYSIVKQIIVFGFIFSFINLGWSLLRKTLLQLQELKSLQFESIRFARNYDVFKNTLLAKMKITLPESIFVLGNKESKTTITVITNPFCGHCKEVHEILDRILDRHHDLIRINVIIKTNFETENEDAKKMYRSLAKIYMENGEIAFRIALKKLFNNVKLEEWLSIYNLNIAATSFDENFDFCYKWCKENNYNFTPAIFINGYEYPQVYDRKNLEFFVSELIDDSNLN